MRRRLRNTPLLLGMRLFLACFSMISQAVTSDSPDLLLPENPYLLLAEASPLSETMPPAAAPAALTHELHPGVAASLAIAPGILVHGSGHFYAGRPVTGTALLLVEAASLYMAYRGGMDIYAATRNFNIEENQGRSGQVSYGIGMAVGGVMLFLASWFYDITGSPIAAVETNQSRRRAGQGPTIRAQVTEGGVQVVIGKTF